MNILKTPHEKLLEEAGATPYTNGMVKTPRQLLFEESGALPQLADGGEVFQKNPEDMRAEMMAANLAQGQPQPEQEETEVPDIENRDVFDALKIVINNPGQVQRSELDPLIVRELLKLFGPNIFAPEQPE